MAVSYFIAPPGVSFGDSTLGNTAGDTGTVGGRLVLAGGNNITLSGSSSGASLTLTISGPNGGGAGVSTLGNTLGATGTVGGQLVFAGGSNITLSQSTNGNSATITILGVNPSAGTQTAGISNLGNTLGTSGVITGSAIELVFAGGNNITLSQSLNGSSATITVIGPTIASSLTAINLSAGTTSNNLSAFVLSNSNNISFGLNGSTITAIVTVASSLTAINVSAGTTSNNLSALSFNNANGVTFGLNASTITASVAAQSNQTLGMYAIGTTAGAASSTTMDARSISFSAFGPMSLGFSASSVLLSLDGALYSPMHAFLGGI